MVAELPSLLQFLLSVLKLSNHHPVVQDSDTTEEYLEEEGEFGEDAPSPKEEIDEITGDFEETPAQIVAVRTEYDHVIERSFVVISKLMCMPDVRSVCQEGLYSMLVESLQHVSSLLNGSSDELAIQEACVMMRLLSYLDFESHNLDILILLSSIIQSFHSRSLTRSECYLSNVYLNGKAITQFYIDTLLCFKQYIFLLNNQLAQTDIESIITSLYSTITQSVTVPPNLLLITISHVLLYLASNCSIQNLSNLACACRFPPSHLVITPLTTNFTKATAQCPLIIQRQLLLFSLYLLVHNLRGDVLQNALSSLLLPLFSNIQGPSATSPTLRRSGSFRFAAGSASVVSTSVFSRSVYLLTAVIKVSYSMNKSVRSVVYPQLLPALAQIAQYLCESCDKNDSSCNYENCRIMWNFVIYGASFFRSHKEDYQQFFPIIASLLQQLPGVLSRVTNSVKSILCGVWGVGLTCRRAALGEDPAADQHHHDGAHDRSRIPEQHGDAPVAGRRGGDPLSQHGCDGDLRQVLQHGERRQSNRYAIDLLSAYHFPLQDADCYGLRADSVPVPVSADCFGGSDAGAAVGNSGDVPKLRDARVLQDRCVQGEYAPDDECAAAPGGCGG